MKTDLYTKAVLTVIAICLSIIAIKDLEIFPKAYADNPSANVKTNPNYGLIPLGGTIDVNIVDINTSDKLGVNIAEVGGYSFSGKIPVVIKENQDK